MNSKYLLPVAALVLIQIFAMPTNAQTYKGKQVTHPSLICGNTTPGKSFTLGIRMKLEPEWHTYWENPGDAGLPMTAELMDANGFTCGALRFATPHKYVTSDAVLYGYDSDVVFLLPIKPPVGEKKTPQFKVKLTWLACKEVCLPGSATLELNADSVSDTECKENQRLLDRWTAKLPQPGSGFNLEKVGTTVTEKDGKILVFVKFLEMAPGTITDFFPKVIDGFVTDYVNIVIGETGITLNLTAESKDSKLKVINGLALIGLNGYEVSFPIGQ